MKNPEPDSFDTLLEQTLQRNSAKLSGDFFAAQVTAHIEAQQRKMKSLRLLPLLMAFFGGVIVGFTTNFPSKASDPDGIAVILSSLWKKLEPLLAFMLQPVAGTHLQLGWIVLAGTAALCSVWLANRETATFRL